MELIVQGLAQSNAEDLEVGMCLNHSTSIAVNLAHPLKQHRGLSGSLFTNDEMVVTNATSGNNVVDFELFISGDPILLMAGMILARHHARDFKSGVPWIERIIDLVQDQMLVVLVIRIPRGSIELLVRVIIHVIAARTIP